MIFSIEKVNEALDALGFQYYRMRIHQYHRMMFSWARARGPDLTLRLKTLGLVTHDRILTGREPNEIKLDWQDVAAEQLAERAGINRKG